jgi:hypothetical protein
MQNSKLFYLQEVFVPSWRGRVRKTNERSRVAFFHDKEMKRNEILSSLPFHPLGTAAAPISTIKSMSEEEAELFTKRAAKLFIT